MRTKGSPICCDISTPAAVPRNIKNRRMMAWISPWATCVSAKVSGAAGKNASSVAGGAAIPSCVGSSSSLAGEVPRLGCRRRSRIGLDLGRGRVLGQCRQLLKEALQAGMEFHRVCGHFVTLPLPNPRRHRRIVFRWHSNSVHSPAPFDLNGPFYACQQDDPQPFSGVQHRGVEDTAARLGKIVGVDSAPGCFPAELRQALLDFQCPRCFFAPTKESAKTPHVVAGNRRRPGLLKIVAQFLRDSQDKAESRSNALFLLVDHRHPTSCHLLVKTSTCLAVNVFQGIAAAGCPPIRPFAGQRFIDVDYAHSRANSWISDCTSPIG